MSDNNITQKMADDYTIDIPKLNLPDSSPEWVQLQAVFPQLFSSIYERFNGVLKKVIADFNR